MTPATLSEPQAHPILPIGQIIEAGCDNLTVVRSTNWDEMTRRLLIYAGFRTSRYGLSTSFYKSRVDDYVQEAVKLFLEGKRHYQPRSNFTLYHFFCSVIDSLVSHDADKVKRRKEVVIEAEEGDETSLDAIPENRLASPGDFEDELVVFHDVQRFIDGLAPDLQPYARLRLEMERTAVEYAEALGTTESKIRNMDRRIRRRRNQW